MTTEHQSFISSLESLLTWYKEHPEAPHFTDVRVAGFGGRKETPELVKSIAKQLGTFGKTGIGNTVFRLDKQFGVIELSFLFWRDKVCQKRIVKTETITSMVVDPAAPLVERTYERESVEWDCPILLEREQA